MRDQSDFLKKILAITKNNEENENFQNALQYGFSILQLYLAIIHEDQKWDAFLQKIIEINDNPLYSNAATEEFKLKLIAILKYVEKSIGDTKISKFLTADIFFDLFNIPDKTVKKSVGMAGHMSQAILDELLFNDVFHEDVIFFISNKKGTCVIRYLVNEKSYLCYNNVTGDKKNFSSKPELINYLQETLGNNLTLEMLTWNENRDLEHFSRHKNEFISKYASILLSETGLHFIAQNEQDELKNIINLAKFNDGITDAIAKALIMADQEGGTGLYAIAGWAPDHLTTLFKLANNHNDIKDAIAKALIMADQEGNTVLYAIAGWAPDHLTTLFKLADNHNDIKDAIAKALIMTNHRGETSLHVIAGWETVGKTNHLTALFELASNHNDIRDAIAKTLNISCHRGITGLDAIASWGRPSQFRKLLALAKNHENLKTVIEEMSSIVESLLIQKILLFMEIDSGQSVSEKIEKEIYDGVCYGLSLVYSYMSATGKLDWWIDSLKKFSKWDGEEESLNEKSISQDANSSNPPNIKPRKTDDYLLYKRIVNYVLYNHKQTVHESDITTGKSVNLFLQPLLNEAESRTNAFRFFSEKGQIIRQEKITGHLNEEILKSLLIGENFNQEAIYLIRNNGHVGAIRYADDTKEWYLYDPRYAEAEKFSNDDAGKDALVIALYKLYRGPNKSISIEIATWKKDCNLDFFSTFYETLSPENKLTLFQEKGLHEIARWAPEQLPIFLAFAKEQDKAKDEIAAALQRTTEGNWSLLHTIAKCAATQLSTLFELATTHEGIRQSIASVLEMKNDKGNTPLDIITEAAPDQLDILFRLTGKEPAMQSNGI